ncbi:hypothetical protein BV22DRAFT_549396 [Leucogyrophana mollusca]|uniref:Uncharacterized protein n=1 Tax=Leucogyrophana mollusca TaxID=85980 RepID=A0ACB8BDN6_9AGAM|nr:hypothetical protein BV22DRAFT_549396 [Leucogyrophana mollusca]
MVAYSIASFYGPMYWGFVASTSLAGTTIMQGYQYYSRNADRRTLHIVVGTVLILDLATTLLMACTINHYFLQDWGQYETFAYITLSWCLENGVTAAVTCITQLLFASRIYLVTRQYAIFSPYDRIIVGAIVLSALGSFAAGMVKAVFVGTTSVTHVSSVPMQIALCSEEGLAVVSDILTTCTLCSILASARGSVKKTRSRLRNLFFFILNRGILVTIVQIGMLVAYLSARSYLYWMPFHLTKSKLYTNTMLAMLNSRGGDETWSNVRTLQIRPSLLASAILNRSRDVHKDPEANKGSTAAMNEEPTARRASGSSPVLSKESRTGSKPPSPHP